MIQDCEHRVAFLEEKLKETKKRADKLEKERIKQRKRAENLTEVGLELVKRTEKAEAKLAKAREWYQLRPYEFWETREPEGHLLKDILGDVE